jgi:small subunit ribosomal protein S6
MFLFDPTFGSTFENCETEIRRLMERAEAELVFCRKWDERRLAYKVKGRKRGLYVLTYFKSPTGKIAGLERDSQLSENILRVLILRADEVTPDMMEKAIAMRGTESGAEGGARRGKPGEEGEMAEKSGDAMFDGRRDSRRSSDKRRRRPDVVEAAEQA